MMKTFIPLTCVTMPAVVLFILIVAPGRSVAQQPRPATDLSQRLVVNLKVPEALRLRHEAFQAQCAKATREQGTVGEAARAIENLANTHFAKAKDVFPALGLLPLLSEGKVAPEMADAG